MQKRLTDEQVENIRQRVHKTDTISSLAREFGVDRSTIYNRLSEKRRKENIIRSVRYRKTGSTIASNAPRKKRVKFYKSSVAMKSGSLYGEILKKHNKHNKHNGYSGNEKISVLFAHKMRKK